MIMAALRSLTSGHRQGLPPRRRRFTPIRLLVMAAKAIAFITIAYLISQAI